MVQEGRKGGREGERKGCGRWVKEGQRQFAMGKEGRSTVCFLMYKVSSHGFFVLREAIML